jgi:hypothetical protein
MTVITRWRGWKTGVVEAQKADTETCLIDGCRKAVKVLGMCRKHYDQIHWLERSRGIVIEPRDTWKVQESCVIQGCDGKLHTKGLCDKHYRQSLKRLRRLSLKQRPVPRVWPTSYICAVVGCGLKRKSKEFCNKHAQKLKRTGTTDDSAPREPRFCTVSGCTRKYKSKGLCQKHYLRLRINGTTDDPKPRALVRKICSRDGCVRTVRSLGLCKNHYNLQNRSMRRAAARCRKELISQ